MTTPGAMSAGPAEYDRVLRRRLRAAIEFLLEVGVENIAPVVQSLGDQIAEGVLRKGYEILGARTPANGAGIVSFRKVDGEEADAIVEKLQKNSVVTASRAGWVRASPHFYIEPAGIEKLLELLP